MTDQKTRNQRVEEAKRRRDDERLGLANVLLSMAADIKTQAREVERAVERALEVPYGDGDLQGVADQLLSGLEYLTRVSDAVRAQALDAENAERAFDDLVEKE